MYNKILEWQFEPPLRKFERKHVASHVQKD